ncbi:MAG: hypothetical protein KGZ82_00910 [Bacteroidales bacterium]|nr:hypothetical protein [Bacteroidales bacterium]
MKSKIVFILGFLVTLGHNIHGQGSDTLIIYKPYIEQNFAAIPTLDTTSSNGITLYATNETALSPVWLDDQDKGILPYDVLAHDGNVYVFGHRKLLIYSESTNSLTTTIDLEEFSQHTSHLPTNRSFEGEARLAIDEANDLLYIADESIQVLALDLSTNTLLSQPVISKPSWFNEEYVYQYQILKFDNRKGLLYWVINGVRIDQFAGSLLVYDAATQSIVKNYYEVNTLIKDIAINAIHDVFYLYAERKVKVFSSNTFNLLSSIMNNTGQYGTEGSKLLYVYDPANSIHKLYAFSADFSSQSPKILIINGNNYSAYTYVNSPLDIVSACAYNAGNSTVIIGGGLDQSTPPDVYIFNAATNIIVSSYNTRVVEGITGLNEYTLWNSPLSITILDQNKILIGKISEVVLLDPSTSSITQIKEGPNQFFYRQAHSTVTGNSYVISSYIKGDLLIVDSSGVLQDTDLIGYSPYNAFYNEQMHETYFYNRAFLMNDAQLFVMENASQEVTSYSLGDYLMDLVYSHSDNKIYFVTANQGNEVQIFDCSTKAIESTSITLNYSNIRRLFVGKEGYLLCAVENGPTVDAGIALYNFSNATVNYQTLGNNIKVRLRANFVYDHINDAIYVASYEAPLLPGSSNNKSDVVRIDFANPGVYSFGITNNPDKMVFSPTHKKVYIRHEGFDYVTVIDATTNSVDQLSIGYQVNDLVYASVTNSVYFSSSEGRIDYLSCAEDIIQSSKPITMPQTVTSLVYNTYNHKLYALVPYNKDNSNQMELWSISIIDNYFRQDKVSFDNYERLRDYPYTFMNQLAVDFTDNRIYFASGHSKIDGIQCEVEVMPILPSNPVAPYFDWVSFPRLDRTGDNYVSMSNLMETMQPLLPDGFNIEGRADISLNVISANYDLNSNLWNYNDLTQVRSTRGYIIEVPFDNNYLGQDDWYQLPMTGTRIDPATPVDVYYYGDRFNFVGYFLSEQQDPLHALQYVLPNLRAIKAKYWSAAKLGDCSSSQWISSKRYPIKYGDMIQLMACDAAFDFTWNSISPPEQSRQYRDPVYFSFTEEPDYTPVFIQLDAKDNPTEIGLYIDGSCYGAVVVEPSDSLALIRGFLQGAPEGELEFELYYGEMKSGRTNRGRIRNYQVYNPDKERNESRKIKRSENRSYYLVNLKSESLAVDQSVKPTMVLHPSPVNSASVIQLQLPEEYTLDLRVFDAGGRMVKVVYHGTYSKGNYEKQIDPADAMLPGVYFVSGFIGNTTINHKFVVLR